MKRDNKLPSIEVEKNLRKWVEEQARQHDRGIGPWIRRLLTDIKDKQVKIVRVKPVEDIQTREA